MVKVVAGFSVKKEKIEEFLNLTSELVEATRKEDGCIVYEMYQDEKNPSALFMLEEWQSRQALDEHMSSVHFTTLIPRMDACTDAETAISVCSKVL